MLISRWFDLWMLEVNLQVILTVFLRKLTAFIGERNEHIYKNNASSFDSFGVRMWKPKGGNNGKWTCNGRRDHR